MQKNYLLLIACFLCFGSVLKGQDIHFSQFQLTPVITNPAQAGAFSGTARIGLIYRDQAFGYLKGSYKTPGLSIDSPIAKGFRKYDWIGVGVGVFQDVAGSTKLTTTDISLAVSYHLALDKKRRNVLTIAGQIGYGSKRFAGEVDFEDNLENRTTVFAANEKSSASDISAGLLFKSKINKTTNMAIGVSFGHINSPKYDLNKKDFKLSELPFLLGVQANVDVQLSEKFSFSPAIFYQTIAKHQEWVLHALAGYNINKDVKFNFGVAYRGNNNDAVIPMLGVDWKDLKVGLAFDTNLSLSDISKGNGAIELAATYIYKLYKKPKVKPIILCPRL